MFDALRELIDIYCAGRPLRVVAAETIAAMICAIALWALACGVALLGPVS